MKQKDQTNKISAFPYTMTLVKSLAGKKLWKNVSLEKNHIKLFVAKGGLIFIAANIDNRKIKKPIQNIPSVAKLTQEINEVLTNKKKKQILLYDLMVDILEALGFTPPLVEMDYELIHNHAHWVEIARNYYYAAKILQRNYSDVMQNYKIRKRKSKKISKKLEETYYTDRIVIYLYSRTIECILKSRIYYILEVTYNHLTEHKKILEKRQVKKWAEKNLYSHDINQLARIAKCSPRKKVERYDYDQITDILMDGKYPGPKKQTLYDGISNGELELATLARVNNTDKKIPIKNLLSGDKMFNYFDKLVLNACEKCYGREFRDHFHEWHRPKIVRQITAWGIPYNKEVRERNSIIRLALKQNK